MKTLLTGGVKSGKSSRALFLAADFPAERYFLATATAFDDEMRDRIRKHQAERLGRFITIEETCDIHLKVRNAMILDCIPMWLNNLFFTNRESDWEPILSAFIERLPDDIIIVSNETNMGIIPADAVSRRYGMVLGIINSRLAQACDRVELLVAGLPLRLK